MFFVFVLPLYDTGGKIYSRLNISLLRILWDCQNKIRNVIIMLNIYYTFILSDLYIYITNLYLSITLIFFAQSLPAFCISILFIFIFSTLLLFLCHVLKSNSIWCSNNFLLHYNINQMVLLIPYSQHMTLLHFHCILQVLVPILTI